MVILKDDSNLSGLTHYVRQWRFSKAPPARLPNFSKVDHGFRFDGSKNFTVRELHTTGRKLQHRDYIIHSGMQGKVLRVGPWQSFVEFQNFRDERGLPIRCWLPNRMLSIGDKPFPGQWTVKYHFDSLEVPDLDTATVINDSSQDKLSRFITTYLRLCFDSDSHWMPEEFLRLLGPNGNAIHHAHATLCRVLKATKVYDILRQDNFNINQIKSCCPRLVDDGSVKHKMKFVIYFIWYQEDSGQTHLYIGKTSDLDSRIARYKYDTTNSTSRNYNGYHHQLRRQVKVHNRHMGVIANLGNDETYENFNGIAEQMMVSLLDTYRSQLAGMASKINVSDLICDLGVAKGSATDNDESSDIQKIRKSANDLEHYMMFKAIAKKAFSITGQARGVGRMNFGINNGVNWNSPLTEGAGSTFYTRTLWLKTESWVAEENVNTTGTTYKVANFRKSKKTYANWTANSHIERSGNTSHWQVGNFFHGPYLKDGKKKLFTMEYTVNCEEYDHPDDVIDGTEFPQDGDEFATVFEARLDWKPHEHGYACLPVLGPWKDWDRANSWAFRIDWRTPDGENHHRYFSYSRTCSYFLDPTESGTQNAYDIGMAVSRWQLGDAMQNEGKESWMRECVGQMRTRVHVYDCLTWTQSFEVPEPIRNVPSGARKTRQQMIMEAESLRTSTGQQLLHADRLGTKTSMMKTDGQRKRTRHKCDTCYMINAQKCIKKDQGCETCFKNGREFCTWSQYAPQADYSPWEHLVDPHMNHPVRNRLVRAALLDRQPWDFHRDSGADGVDLDFTLLPKKLTDQERADLLAIWDKAAEEEDD